jgi:hypothetical protein
MKLSIDTSCVDGTGNTPDQLRIADSTHVPADDKPPGVANRPETDYASPPRKRRIL